MTARNALLAGLLLLVAGCVSTEPMLAPEASVSDLRFENLSLFETTAIVTVRVTNENPFPLVCDGAVYKLALNGRNVGKGLTGEALELPRLGTVTCQVPVHIGNLRLLLQGLDALEGNEIRYELKSTLYVAGKLGRRRLKSQVSGVIKLPEGETRALRSFAPRQQTFVP